MKKILVVALLLTISAVLFAGPFGIEFGWTLEQLEGFGAHAEYISTQGNVKSYFVEPNAPHANLYLYVVFIDDEYGLYLIRAVSPAYNSEYSVRTIFNRLKGQLSSVYGAPEEIDEISLGSDWKGSQNFIKSMLYGDRALSAAWSFSQERDGLKDIFLGVMPISESEATVFLEYCSCDYEVVESKFNAVGASVL